VREELQVLGSNNYSSSAGEDCFRRAVADWYKTRFNVQLNPDKEVCTLIGSKEGLANIGRVFVNPGDRTLLPDPSYPVYAQGSTILSDATPATFRLEAETGFQPDFPGMNADSKTRLLFLNYPNNPTGAVATEETLRKTVEFCRQHNLLLCYDNAYSEVCLGNYQAPSALQFDIVKEHTVEFNSCSKMLNMTGYRVGFAVGNQKAIAGLKKIKSQIDSGVPKFIQKAAASALKRYFDSDLSQELRKNNDTLLERFNSLVRGLRKIGLEATIPRATFYLWVNVGMNGVAFAKELLKLGVVATPGSAFGQTGNNYVRFSITQSTDRIAEAALRMEKLDLHHMRLHPSC
jgi:LL-diaminopimelate aminotransferase